MWCSVGCTNVALGRLVGLVEPVQLNVSPTSTVADVLLAGDQGPKKRMRKRGEGIGEFQIQGGLTELMSQVGFEDAVTEYSSMRIRLSSYKN